MSLLAARFVSKVVFVVLLAGAWSVAPACAAETAHAEAAPTESAPAVEEAVRQQAQTLEQVRAAYAQTDTYYARKIMTLEQSMGGEVNRHQAQVDVALDRKNKKLRVESDELLIVSDGQSLRLLLKEMPKRYLEVPAPELEFEQVMKTAVMAAPLLLPDMALLLGHPMKDLLGEGQVTAEEPDRVKVTGDEGVLTMTLDPQTHLIRSGELTVDLEGIEGADFDEIKFSFEVDVKQQNQPLPDTLWQFEAPGASAVKSLDKLFGRPAHPLVGQRAPAAVLQELGGEEVNLAEIEQRVIILDFWATWCGPCREAMPLVQSVMQWAQDQNKPVKVYAVNIEETPEQITAFLEQQKLSLPVLLDTEGAVAQQYQVRGIPQTVVIVDGVIRDVHVGYSPNLADTLKASIEEALAAE